MGPSSNGCQVRSGGVVGKEKLCRAAGIVGLACYWPYLRRFEFEQLFWGYETPSAMWVAYTAVTWLNVLVLVLCALRHAGVEKRVGHPAFGAVAGASAALGYLAISLAPALGGGGESVGLLLGSALLSAGFCGLTIAWMSWLVRGAGGRVLEDSLLSFALCCVLSFSSLLPPYLVLAGAVATPLVSGALWVVASRGPVPRGKPGIPAFTAEKPRASLVVSVVLLFLIGRITAGLLHFEGGSIQLIERVSSVVVSCLILVAIYMTAKKAENITSMVRQAWVALVIAFLVGEAVVVLFGGVAPEVGMALFWASLGCFEVLILAVVAMWCGSTGASPVVALGLTTVFLRVIPSWVGKYAVPAAMNALGIAPASTVGAFVLASSVLLMASTLLFLNAMVEAGSGAVAAAVPGAVRADAVGRLSETYLLTPRESDVLGLLLQGLSYQAIADRLHVTLGTVQTHTKGLYRKLDVHSRDELVERAQHG